MNTIKTVRICLGLQHTGTSWRVDNTDHIRDDEPKPISMNVCVDIFSVYALDWPPFDISMHSSHILCCEIKSVLAL